MSTVTAGWFFAQGINRSIFVPTGTLEKITDHVEWVEYSLNIKREKYLENPERWASTKYEDIDDKLLCKVAMVEV